MPNLTTLANVKAWASVSGTSDDALLARLIAANSRSILSYLGRPEVARHVCNDVFDGTGGHRVVLRQWPVVSVSALSVGTVPVAQAAGYGQAGYALEPDIGFPPGMPQAVDLYGYRFERGHANVAVTYTAGYVVQNEPQTAAASVPVAAPYGNWLADAGVTINGVAMSPVTGTPAQGQYAVANGIYTFSAANFGQPVLISYSYVPSDIEQACVEMVADRYSAKDHSGQKSKSLNGQETVSYDTSAMNSYVVSLLQPYRKVAVFC